MFCIDNLQIHFPIRLMVKKYELNLKNLPPEIKESPSNNFAKFFLVTKCEYL